ncbi:major facilitator superfamily domain, general substrate transporter [Aspergillus terreus]|uniref:Major facilitator superfamily domain, general substrate transporter n=1 Tax=Aspergillus terreus TaxID=33178 RepID=A0A5M3YNM7_ASPTE|nr:hypothetical protein ATETN484_0002022900 [Aspergillus terreus]GFF15085.1 major facilitator superfamily domain, general substrate transporter [Aspergillus terreus]
MAVKATPAGIAKEASRVIQDIEVTDPSLPQNWTRTRKWLILIVLSLMSLMVVLHYRAQPGKIIAPVYIGPLSERLGRVPVCHFFNPSFLIFTMIAGFSNSFAMIIVFRFLAGASVSSICQNPAITGDLSTIEERGSAMSLTCLIPILGNAVGPIVRGYITQYLNWRWTFWMMAIVSAALAVIMAAVLKESYVPVIRRKALEKMSSDQEAIRPKQKYLQGWSMATVKALALLAVRPFVILSQSRIAVLMGFDRYTERCTHVPIYARLLPDLRALLQTARPGSPTSPGKPANFHPPGDDRLSRRLFLYGRSLEQRLHWIVPALASLQCGFSLSSSTTPTMNYLVDIFGDRSASAVAAVLPLRYVGGAFMPVAAPYMYAQLGYGWGNSLLGFVLLVALPAPFLAIVRPRRMQALEAVFET